MLSRLQICPHRRSGMLRKPLQGGGCEDLITATSGSAFPWSCCSSGNSELRAMMTTSRKQRSAFCSQTWIFQSRRITSCKQKLIHKSYTASIYTALKIKRWRKLQNRIFFKLFFCLFFLRIWRKSFARGKLQNCRFKCFVLFSKPTWLRTKRRTRKVEVALSSKRGRAGGQNFGWWFLLHPVHPVSRQNRGKRAKTLNSINAILAFEWMWQWETVGSNLTQMENLQVKNYNNRLP